MGIDDSRTPIVTAPVDLILSSVTLAAKAKEVPENTAIDAKTVRKMNLGGLIFIHIPLK
jgi:hypothetical protein